MPKPTNAVELVKKAAVEAVDASKPVHILFGTVISASPLKIQVDQKAIYTEKLLVLTRNVTDFEVDMTVSHRTVVISHGHQVVDTYTGGGSATPVAVSYTHRGVYKRQLCDPGKRYGPALHDRLCSVRKGCNRVWQRLCTPKTLFPLLWLNAL